MHKSQRIPSFPRQRRSACADAALKAEIERIDQMTIEERMRQALLLGQYQVTQKESRLKIQKHEG